MQQVMQQVQASLLKYYQCWLASVIEKYRQITQSGPL